MDLVQYQDDQLIQKALLLLDQYYSFYNELFEKALEIQLLLTEESQAVYFTVKSMQSQIEMYLSAGYMYENVTSAKSAMCNLTKLCYLEGEVGEPHQINQKMIINFGM